MKRKGKSLKADYYRFWGVAAVSFFLDQASKLAASARLAEGETTPVISGVFHFTLVYNTGGVFGLLRGFNSFFIIFSAVFLYFIFYSYKRLGQKCPGGYMPAGLLAGGAAGNLADRIRLSFVIDFIDFRVWPVFNLADTAITIGAALAAWKIYRSNFR